MKAVVAAFNQEKALVGAFSVIIQPVVEPMDRFTALDQADGGGRAGAGRARAVRAVQTRGAGRVRGQDRDGPPRQGLPGLRGQGGHQQENHYRRVQEGRHVLQVKFFAIFLPVTIYKVTIL